MTAPIKKPCRTCAKAKRDRAVYRCWQCDRLRCEHLVGKKQADPTRPGKAMGICSSCQLTNAANRPRI